jgi:hypothetical protein
MKTLADFKRALQTPGVKVETLAIVQGIPEGIPGKRLYVGMMRYVNKYDTTGVYLKENEGDEGRGSFLAYDKAGDWVFTEDTATNTVYGYAYRIILPAKAVA